MSGNENGNDDLAKLLKMLGLSGNRDFEFEDVKLEVGEIVIEPSMLSPALMRAISAKGKAAVPAATTIAKPTTLLDAPFTPYIQEYPGKITEVTLGADKSQGGSRKPVTIGGSTTPAFYLFEQVPKNPPVISMDVFDMELTLPKAIRVEVEDVWNDTAEWAKRAVDKWGAKVVTLHLLSTDPLIKDTKPADAVKTVEKVLQAVDVPLIIGGCGDPKKDAAIFKEVSEMAAGERVLLSSVTLDMDEAHVLEPVAKSAAKNGHCVLGFTSLDLNNAKELNRKLAEHMPEKDILMDLTTAALGYGLEYSFTIHERARMAALMGDTELQHPVLSGTTNAWAAREAWLSLGPEWEPKRLRGPLWETVTALSLLLAGIDLFMMMHPDAIKTLNHVVDQLMARGKANPERIADWVNAKI